MSIFIRFLIFVAGASAVIYQMSWMRLFAVAFGGPVNGALAALAASLLGLAAGAVAGGRLVGRARRPLRAFGGLQIASGIYCAMLPAILTTLGGTLMPVAGAGPAEQALRVLIALPFIAAPAAMLGASLPVLSRHEVRSHSGLSRTAGLLGASAAVGGAAGLALAVFVLIPAVGLAATVAVAALASLAGGVGALAVHRQRSEELSPAAPAESTEEGKIVVRVRPAGPSDETQTDLKAVSALSVDEERPTESKLQPLDEGSVEAGTGDTKRRQEATETQTDAAAIDSDVLMPGAAPVTLVTVVLGAAAAVLLAVPFARIVGVSMGTTPEVLALGALAALLATGLGALLSSLRADRASDPVGVLAFIWLLAAASIFLLASVTGLTPRVAAKLVSSLSHDPGALRIGRFLVVTAMLLPAFGLLGASFPLALRAYSRAQTHLGRAVGDVSGAARAGLFLGALVAALWLGPSLSLRGAINLAAGLAVLAGALAAAFAASRTERLFVTGVLVLMAAGLIAFANQPEWNSLSLASSCMDSVPGSPDGELALYFEEGSSTVAVVSGARRTVLRIDGAADADDLGDLSGQVLLAQLPLALHGGAEDVLLLGLGSGITAGSVLRCPVKTLTVVEQSRAVLEALPDFAKSSRLSLAEGKIADARLSIVEGGARGYLAAPGAEFDVILSRCSRPWAYGASDMLTREALMDARRRLRPGGYFCLSLKIDRASEQQFKGIMRAFVEAFGVASMWEAAPGEEYILVGWSPAAGNGEVYRPLGVATLRSRISGPGTRDELSRIGISDEIELLGTFFMPMPMGRLVGLMDMDRTLPLTDDASGIDPGSTRAVHSGLAGQFNLNAYRGDLLALVTGLPLAADERVELLERLALIRSARDHVFISRQFAAMGDHERALAAARTAERLDPRNYAARLIADGQRLSEASLDFGSGRYTRALELLEAFTPRNHSEAKLCSRTKARILAARALRRAEDGDEEAALSDSLASVQLVPRWPKNMMARAKLLKKVGKYTQAIELADEALHERQMAPEIIAFKAECYRLAGDPNEAAKRIDEALRRHPGNVALLVARGKIYETRGEVAQAANCFDAAVRNAATPEFVKPLRGQAMLKLGNYQMALADLLSAAAHFPDDADIKLELAKAFFYLGQRDLEQKFQGNARENMARANTHCLAAIELGAEEGRARLILAAIALTLDRLDEAKHHLRRASELGAKPTESFLEGLAKKRRARAARRREPVPGPESD